MKLVNRFYIRDIREYEQENNVNIIKYFEDVFDIYNLIELIKLGNKTGTLEAVNLLYDYLKEGENDLETAYVEIRDTLLGKPVEQGGDGNLQAVEFNSLTDLFNELCKQAMSIGLTYSEFWSMDTKEMYQVVEGIQERKIEQYNEKMIDEHRLALKIGAAVWGKLDKKPYQIDNPNKTIWLEEFGEVTMEEYRTLQALGAVR